MNAKEQMIAPAPPIIAGPCAAESREFVIKTAEEAQKRGIEVVRLSLQKPRTKPNFEGVGKAGIPWLVEVAQMGLTPATEVMSTSFADNLINTLIKDTDAKRILIWLGSRNQNHLFQRDIGRMAAGESRVMVMIKNQPWRDQDHWEGIIEHVLSGGASEDQLLVCHRGFAPGEDGLRNTPDFDMAMNIKEKTGLPMLFDPSHVGGSVPKVLEMAKQAASYRRNGEGFDGLILEVHINPSQALSDAKQQLTWPELDGLLEEIKPVFDPKRIAEPVGVRMGVY